MDFSEAKQILLHDVFDDDGTLTHLRLGADPGTDRIMRLRIALRGLWRELAPAEAVPRDIAYACGFVIAVEEQCLEAVRQSPHVPPSSKEEIELRIRDLAQGAFEVLAGAHADVWVVARPDLGESG
jgi:hypothetical protein